MAELLAAAGYRTGAVAAGPALAPDLGVDQGFHDYRYALPGIKALVGESFADIFFGNCVALGIPCVTASEKDVAALMAAIDADPAHDLTVDVAALTATYRNTIYKVDLPAGVRKQLLEGTWDATRVLLDAGDRIRQTAERLPYVRRFA